jgi:hypothetical protein
MIISIRGTSGSGKSHLTRRIMAMYPGHQEVIVPGRKHPVFNVLRREPPTGALLVVPGHYRIANGGVDTLDSIDDAYNTVRMAAMTPGMDVMYEGKNMSDGTTHFMSLIKDGFDARVVHLTTPIDECVASVRARGHKIARTSIEKTHRKVEGNVQTFRTMRVPNVFAGDREQCFQTIKWWLQL